MRKVLYVLSYLNDDDAAWLAANGAVRRPAAGEAVIREGVTIDKLFVVLSGALGVTLANGETVATLGAGEVVGEIAFVDSAPPSATVAAMSGAVLLEIEKATLQGKIEDDPGFAARFYKAIAVFLASRLRATTHRLGYGKTGDLASERALEDEIDSQVLDRVSNAGERFHRLLSALGAGTVTAEEPWR
jgi:CRP/FNR family cyclic AMP-dependent transcriptional regulator